MIHLLSSAKQRLSSQIERSEHRAVKAISADRWIVNSLLQKAIRRSEIRVAESAALAFLQYGGSAIWRRFMIIAFEDVGVASPDVVAMTVAASCDAQWRRQVGSDEVVAIDLARMLSNAPKNRSAEHLITTIKNHPSFETERLEAFRRSVLDNLEVVGQNSTTLLHRAAASWSVTEGGWTRTRSGRNGWPDLLEVFARLGVPSELVEATGMAASRVRDAIILMVPLIWLASERPVTTEIGVPRSRVWDGLPMYALDKHTRVGREAIRELVKFNHAVRECLVRYAAPERKHDAAYMAAFYADAAPLARKVVWRASEELEKLGTEADLLKVGVAPEGVQPLLQVFRENLDHLNKLRAHAFGRRQGFVDVATALVADEERWA